MKSFKGLKPEVVECVDSKLNAFSGRSGDRELVVRQPRERDSGKLRLAWKSLSPKTIIQYKRKQLEDTDLYDMKWRCRQPLYTGTIPGLVTFIMIAEEKIVGLADFMIRFGADFPRHQIPLDEVGCSMNLCVLDQYQGLGIGGFYSAMNEAMAKHYGAQWMIGNCRMDEAMYHLRTAQGWETVSTGRSGPKEPSYAVIKKRI